MQVRILQHYLKKYFQNNIMALNSSILRSQLIMKFTNSNATAQLAALNISTAFDLYIKSIQNMIIN